MINIEKNRVYVGNCSFKTLKKALQYLSAQGHTQVGIAHSGFYFVVRDGFWRKETDNNEVYAVKTWGANWRSRWKIPAF